MTEITLRIRTGIAARLSGWVGRCQRNLSDRMHAAADERARRYGWQVTEGTGRFGFGTRTYRDPRFDGRRAQLSPGPAQAAARDHSRVGPE